MNRKKMIIIMGIVLLGSILTLFSIVKTNGDNKTMADVALEESVNADDDKTILELLEKHDDITIAIETEEGYDPKGDIEALIKEIEFYNTNRTILIKKSLEELLKGNKDKSEEFYFKALFGN